VSGLTKSFAAVKAVDDLSFTVEPGSITGFLGPNGAGKTTTLRMLLGLVSPDAGTATIGGRSYATLPIPTDEVGAVLEASGFHPARSGRDHLRVYCDVSAYPHARADQVLALVGLSHVARRAVRGYSLGMRQRLALAGALLGDPRVLVLDEPANGLDPGGITWMRGFLRELAREGRTVLLSSHALPEMQQLVEDVVLINHGRLVRQGPLAELVGSDGTMISVRTPRAEKLVAALQRVKGDRVRIEASGPDGLRVAGVGAAEVGHLAFVERVELHELATERGDLEHAFFALTAEPEQSSS
jgi:ABC-2 type transport system ATP-binding protein